MHKLALLLSVCCGFGCEPARPGAQSPGSNQPAEYFSLRTPTSWQQMKLDGPYLLGPNVSVQRFDDGYRGRLGQLDVFVDVSQGNIKGLVGQKPINLKVEAGPGVLKIEGLCNPRLCSLTWTREKLQGNAKNCGFELKANDPQRLRYSGFHGCGRGVHFMDVEIPRHLSERSVDEQGVWLSLFLMTL